MDRLEARQKIYNAFYAFLNRFSALTEIQEKAMDVILEGDDAILVAPSASGKTEAVLAPLCFRLLSQGKKVGIKILYISPTRSLVNDLEVRTKGPVENLGLSLAVRTGDRKQSILKNQPDILVTTPESFDSLLCRHPNLFQSVISVVVDEAHFLDGTYRGDQLTILLRRLLTWHCQDKVQLIAMSATVQDPNELGKRLFLKEAKIIKVDKQRPIQFVEAEDYLDALQIMRRLEIDKALIFCNSRQDVELYARKIRSAKIWPEHRIAVHHASLSKTEREGVEKAFRWWGAGLIVCTNTLEVGIDVGDVDAVVLMGAPLSVASFYQRVGRGCRRKTGMVAICVPLEKKDVEMFKMIKEAVQTQTMPVQHYERDLSVVVQQAFSMLYGRPKGIRISDLVDMLKPLFDEKTIVEILQYLINQGLIQETFNHTLIASSVVMDMGEKGLIHSNIPDEPAVTVIDLKTGMALGEMVVSKNAQVLTLGGYFWQVLHREKGVVKVVRLPYELGGVNSFKQRPAQGAFSKYLPPYMRGDKSITSGYR